MFLNHLQKILRQQDEKDVAKTVVGAVEQLYEYLHGQERYDKAVESMSEMLAENGIAISKLEIKMLIEFAVSEFNKSVSVDFGGEQLEAIETETKKLIHRVSAGEV